MLMKKIVKIINTFILQNVKINDSTDHIKKKYNIQ